MIINTSKQPIKHTVPSSVSEWKKQRSYYDVNTDGGVLYAIVVSPKWYSGKDVIVKIGRSQNYLGAVKRIKSWDRLMGVGEIVRIVKTRVPIILAERIAKYDAISLCGFGYNSKGEQIVLMDGVSKWIAVTSDILPEFFEMPTEITSDFANTYINGVDIKIKSRLLSK